MSVQSFHISDTVTVTPTAAEHFRRQLLRKGGAGVRISLKKAGCTGFKYVFDEVAEAKPEDVELQLDNGVILFIDPAHVPALRGAEIDYTAEGLNSTLKVNNPNVKDACGCGESFSI